MLNEATTLAGSWASAPNAVTASLAPGAMLTVRYSSLPDSSRLNQMALWATLSTAVAGGAPATLLDTAKAGLHWMLTPYREITLVHAVAAAAGASGALQRTAASHGGADLRRLRRLRHQRRAQHVAHRHERQLERLGRPARRAGASTGRPSRAGVLDRRRVYRDHHRDRPARATPRVRRYQTPVGRLFAPTARRVTASSSPPR